MNESKISIRIIRCNKGLLTSAGSLGMDRYQMTGRFFVYSLKFRYLILDR